MNKRELAWKTMKNMEFFTVSEIAKAVEMDLEQCRTTINKLIALGCVEYVRGAGCPGNPKRYKVNPNRGSEPRLGKGAKHGDKIKRQGRTGQQLVWNALRINRVIVVSSVVAVTQCSRKSVEAYLRILENAGYLSCRKVDTRLANKEIECHESVWKLIRETGPKSPIHRRGQGCWDQNEGKFYSFKSAGKNQGGMDEVA